MAQSFWKAILCFLKKWNIHLSYDPFLEMKAYIYTHLFIIDQTGNYINIHPQMNRLTNCGIFIMECHSAIEKGMSYRFTQK